MSFQLTLTVNLSEEAALMMEATVLANAALEVVGEVTSVDALFRFNGTEGRFQLLLGDPSDPAIILNFPTDLAETDAIRLAALTLQIVITTLLGVATAVQIDSGGSNVFIISYS